MIKPPGNTLSLQDVGIIFASQGIDTGKIKIFEQLRNFKILDQSNVPYRSYIQAGWFKVLPGSCKIERRRGIEEKLYTRTFLTEKGINGVRRMLNSKLPTKGFYTNLAVLYFMPDCMLGF